MHAGPKKGTMSTEYTVMLYCSASEQHHGMLEAVDPDIPSSEGVGFMVELLTVSEDNYFLTLLLSLT